MPEICYVEKNFSTKSLDIIDKANAICAAKGVQDNIARRKSKEK